MDRRTFISGLGASIALGPAALTSTARALADGPAHPDLTTINPQHLEIDEAVTETREGSSELH